MDIDRAKACKGSGYVDSSSPGLNVGGLGARAVPMHTPGLCREATMSLSVHTGTIVFSSPFTASLRVCHSCTRDRLNEVERGLVLLGLVDPTEGQRRWD